MAEPYIILVADDEKVIRDGCALILKPEGYRVTAAVNGQEALEIMAAEPVNVVLCDLKMPVMGALEVLDVAAARYPDVPIIIITGHGTVDDAVACMKKGAYDFVTKPFRVDHLTLAVRRALDKQQLEREARRLQEEQARNLYSLALEQSRLHTIVNCMADGLLVTNREGEVVLCNPSLMQLLEKPAPLAAPLTLERFCKDPAFASVIQGLLAKAATQPGMCISQELCQGRVHLRALSAAFQGPGQEFLGTVTVFHDITSFKELDEMKNDFVRSVSHELRAPLAAIAQQHAVILDGLAGDLTEKQRELLTRGQAKIKGLLELINDLLDLARMEAGSRHLELVPLDLGEILTEVVELLRARAQSQGIALTLDFHGNPPPVRADRRSLEEVFTNLVANAINYSPDGGDVRLVCLPRGDYLEVRVEDQGVGIPEEEIPKIFDKFYRVKHHKTRQVIGTGLGLPLVKSMVEAHRGVVEVESEPGVGTTFRVLLPTVTAS